MYFYLGRRLRCCGFVYLPDESRFVAMETCCPFYLTHVLLSFPRRSTGSHRARHHYVVQLHAVLPLPRPPSFVSRIDRRCCRIIVVAVGALCYTRAATGGHRHLSLRQADGQNVRPRHGFTEGDHYYQTGGERGNGGFGDDEPQSRRFEYVRRVQHHHWLELPVNDDGQCHRLHHHGQHFGFLGWFYRRHLHQILVRSNER